MRVYKVLNHIVTAATLTFHPSTCRVYDLSHELFQGMPSTETSTPLEVSMVHQDHGKGARYCNQKYQPAARLVKIYCLRKGVGGEVTPTNQPSHLSYLFKRIKPF